MKKPKLFKSKKAQTDDPLDEDTGIVVGDFFYYIKLIIVIVILVIYLLIPGLRLLNSQSKIPINLKQDIYFARLTNDCLSTTHYPFSTKDQNIINEKFLSKENINTCFTKNPLTKVKLEWYDSTGKKESKEIVFSKITDVVTLNKLVLVKTDKGIFSGKIIAELMK